MPVAVIKSLAPGLTGVLRKSSRRVNFLAFSMICLESARAAKGSSGHRWSSLILLQNGAEDEMLGTSNLGFACLCRIDPIDFRMTTRIATWSRGESGSGNHVP